MVLHLLPRLQMRLVQKRPAVAACRGIIGFAVLLVGEVNAQRSGGMRGNDFMSVALASQHL